MFPGLSLAFKIEPLGATFALIASSLWILTSIYAIGYMRGHHEQNQTRFFAFFALAIASTMGIAFAGNMLTLFTFYEVLSVCTYPLVTHSGTAEAKRAGRVYLGIPARHLHRSPAVRDRLYLGRSRNPRLHRRRHPRRQGLRRHGGRPDNPLRLRYRQGCRHAVSPLAAGRHGCAHAGECASPCGRCRQGRRVLRSQGSRLHLRHRSSVVDRRQLLAGLCRRRDHHHRVPGGHAEGQSEGQARLFHRQPAFLHRPRRHARNLSRAIGGAMHIAMHAFGKITLFFCAGASWSRPTDRDQSDARPGPGVCR